jgi:hypothetical protein
MYCIPLKEKYIKYLKSLVTVIRFNVIYLTFIALLFSSEIGIGPHSQNLFTRNGANIGNIFFSKMIEYSIKYYIL